MSTNTSAPAAAEPHPTTPAAAASHGGGATVDELRAFPLFDGLSTDLLEWMLTAGEVRVAADGESFMEPDQTAEAMFIVLSGMLRARLSVRGQPMRVMSFEPGTATGLLPFSRMTKFPVRGFSVGPTRVLVIRRELFYEMLTRSPELGQRLVGLMSDRVRDQEKATQQREKMMALGKLAAGLAHEMNNPAAAILRSADALRTRLPTLTSLAARLATRGLTPAQIAAAKELREYASHRAEHIALSPLERGECEEEVGDWLQARGVPEAWVLAETYVEAGLCRDDLETRTKDLPADAIGDVLAWVETTLASDRLVSEISSSAARIAELVTSVKAYSHMDRPVDKQPTDVTQGIESTVRMLGHCLKEKHLTLERAYADNLPSVSGYPGELNQVWTNLIDNAIDAAPDGGRIRIETKRDDGTVTVRVIDNGPGVPVELQSRIFEPFFTTKPVGEGTGLGLDIVRRIVTQAHSGEITLASKPGETIFTVTLPL